MANHETMEKIPTLLPGIKLFESLSPEILDAIKQSITPTHTYPLAKNARLQTPDDEKKGLFLLFSGKLRFYKINADGKQHTVCIQKEGSVFGQVQTFALGAIGSYVEAMEDSIVAFIPAEKFEPFLHKYPELSLIFLEEISRNMRVQDEWVEHLVFGDLRSKVLYFLNRLIDKFDTGEQESPEIVIPLTHQELADIIGATREAVSLALKELSNEGVLTTGRKTIIVNVASMRKELP